MVKYYATPFFMEALNVSGALYTDILEISLASLRKSESAGFRHRDPAYLFPRETRDAVHLNKDFLFLGHSFSQYGHFLLETLPMLTALLEDSNASGFFYPWGAQDNLLFSILDLLEIDQSRVYVHRDQKVIYSNFEIISRPIVINKSITSANLYYPVIGRLKDKVLTSSEKKLPRKIFLERKSDRVSGELHESVAVFFAKNGFTRIWPEKYSLSEQMEIFASACEIASFPGSQLHSTIFSNSSCRVIEVGDTRSPTKTLENQAICDQISGTEKVFVPYSDDQDSLLSSIFRIL